MTRIKTILSELSILKNSYAKGKSRYMLSVHDDLAMAESHLKSAMLVMEHNKGNKL